MYMVEFVDLNQKLHASGPNIVKHVKTLLLFVFVTVLSSNARMAVRRNMGPSKMFPAQRVVFL